VEGSTSVLVADEAAARILRHAGYQVREAGDSQDVLDQVARTRPQAVILPMTADGELPRGTGIDICRAIKRKTAGRLLPVLIVTSGSPVEAFRAGADDVIRRPLDPDELIARVEVWLRTRRLLGSGQARPVRQADDASGSDPLTGLPDGRAFTARLDEAFARAHKDQAPISVMAVDLDALGELNGRYGRTAGDRLLIACARVLVSACRDGDVVARAGGDEMIALLPDIHFSGCLAVAQRIWREVGATTIEEGGTRLSCAASVGVASYPAKDIENPKDLLRYAHAALARAKAEGHGRICLYQYQGYLFQPEP